jgi:hypothetical protein
VRGKEPWNIPGNPYLPLSGNAGADGFDISWAVDADGNYVDLDTIHFIKIHTAMQADAGWLGEVSTEITGAVKTVPGQSATDAVDIIVIRDVPPVIQSGTSFEAYAFRNGRIMRERKILWTTNLTGSWIDDENILHIADPGQTTIRAFAEDNPEVFAEVQTQVQMPSNIFQSEKVLIRLSPNPANDMIQIRGIDKAEIYIYSISGRLALSASICEYIQTIETSSLAPGHYLVRIVSNEKSVSTRLTIVR